MTNATTDPNERFKLGQTPYATGRQDGKQGVPMFDYVGEDRESYEHGYRDGVRSAKGTHTAYYIDVHWGNVVPVEARKTHGGWDFYDLSHEDRDDQHVKDGEFDITVFDTEREAYIELEQQMRDLIAGLQKRYDALRRPG